jgi:hypothetical protein
MYAPLRVGLTKPIIPAPATSPQVHVSTTTTTISCPTPAEELERETAFMCKLEELMETSGLICSAAQRVQKARAERPANRRMTLVCPLIQGEA